MPAGANLDVDVSWKWLNFFLEDDARLAQVLAHADERVGTCCGPRQAAAATFPFHPALPATPALHPSPCPLPAPRLARSMAAGAC